MDNQHRKIAGYRDLSQYEIDVMNTTKALGKAIEEQINNVKLGVSSQRAAVKRKAAEIDADPQTSDEAERMETIRREVSEEQQRLDQAEPERWIAIARTHFQEGLMALTRATAQPGFF